MYGKFCQTLIKEMNNHILSFVCSKQTEKGYKTFKPYSNDEVKTLWPNVKKKRNRVCKISWRQAFQITFTEGIHWRLKAIGKMFDVGIKR